MQFQREQKYLEFAKDATIGSVSAIIYSAGQIVKVAVEGVLDVQASIAANPDPISQAVAIGAEGIAIGLFATTPLGQKLLEYFGLASHHFAGSGPPKEDPTGIFGSKRTDVAGEGGVHWFATRSQRDQWTKLNIGGVYKDLRPVKRFIFHIGPFKTANEANAEQVRLNIRLPGNTDRTYFLAYTDSGASQWWLGQHDPDKPELPFYEDDLTGASG